MNDIIERIISGELTRDNDETGAHGFWDYAGEQAVQVMSESNIKLDKQADISRERLQEILYNLLWEVAETTTF